MQWAASIALKMPSLPPEREIKATTTPPIDEKNEIAIVNIIKNAFSELKKNLGRTKDPSENVRSLPELHVSANPLSIDKIAFARGLSVGKDFLAGKNRLKGDSHQLEEAFKDLPIGVHQFVFSTGDSAHSTLIIKSDEGIHFWDPNLGLLRCDPNDPKQVILKALKTYPKPMQKLEGQEDAMNHQIIIRQFTPVAQPPWVAGAKPGV